MSKIIYKPHCEKCGSLIDQKVQFRRTEVNIGNRLRYRSADYTFNPYQCKNCGAIFDSAEFQPPEEVTQFLD